jgi:SAM-dependent methyltransferase
VTREEFLFLASDDGRALTAQHADDDPARVALARGLPFAAAVATQVKYLSRAARKLPSYRAARCILSPLGYEQATAEAVALARNYGGELCIDLTCGLGTDAFALSRRFARVVAVERDPLTAEIARHNFALLGATNIEVVCCAAEDFVEQFGDSATLTCGADLVFIDPDRRGEHGRRLYAFEDCAPNVTELMPLLRRMARTVAVKCSPLFDVDMARRLFGDHVLCRATSLDGECRELLVEADDRIPCPRIEAEAVGLGCFACDAVRDRPVPPPFDPLRARWLIIPDVALQKSRTAVDYFRPLGAHIESDNGFAFACETLGAPLGRALAIASIAPFAPRQLARDLRRRGIRRLDLLVRDFPISAAETARRLGVAQGGPTAMAFTRIGGEAVAVELA